MAGSLLHTARCPSRIARDAGAAATALGYVLLEGSAFLPSWAAHARAAHSPQPLHGRPHIPQSPYRSTTHHSPQTPQPLHGQIILQASVAPPPLPRLRRPRLCNSKRGSPRGGGGGGGGPWRVSGRRTRGAPRGGGAADCKSKPKAAWRQLLLRPPQPASKQRRACGTASAGGTPENLTMAPLASLASKSCKSEQSWRTHTAVGRGCCGRCGRRAAGGGTNRWRQQ